MSLSEGEKLLITESFTRIAPISEKVAEVFYNRLFEIAPDTKPLFKTTDMTEQGRKMMQTIATAVGAVYTLDAIAPEMEALGKRHIAYGVTAEQYDHIGDALIWAMEQSLGEDFSPETSAAWKKVYALIAGIAKTQHDKKHQR